MYKRHKKRVEEPALRTWEALNRTMVYADEATCEELLQVELAGRKRKRFLMRIQSRLNKLRGAAALQQLEEAVDNGTE